ncbi:MAG: hypothetical protein EOP48_05380 [Sphingobacteriales bacterium]|nr:MAG: hypothetical protein EOP48_05380 [Sphingobacteriales bacterium]
MHFDEIRGLYTPSYFTMRLATTQDLHPLSDLDIKYLSTYFHEYFHFLQDLTTVFGLNCSWNTYDRTIRALEYAQKTEGEVVVPLPNELGIELLRNLTVQKHVYGDKTPEKAISDKFSIVGIEIVSKAELKDLIPDEANKFVRVSLMDEKEVTTQFWFGGIAVIESMTYLIQGKFFDTSHTPVFPYKAAWIIAGHINGQFKERPELVFSLCEIALYSPYPGLSFYEILKHINDNSIEINETSELYRLGLEQIERKWGLWNKLQKNKDKLTNIVSQLYGHEVFKREREWLIHLIEEGAKIRTSDPSFMLEMYQSETAFGPELMSIYERLGTPETINAENKRWFASPAAMQENDGQIHTVFLTGFKQIQNLLLFGKKDCILIAHCEGSEVEMPIDKYCFNAPWEKTKQDPLCPFAALWKSFGLDAKTIRIS